MKKTVVRKTDGEWKCSDDVLCGVRKAEDKEHLSVFEDEHMISIVSPERVVKNEYFEVRIDIGKSEAAPAQSAHFIEWVELYAADTFMGRSYFSAGVSYPTAVFKVRMIHAQGPLKAWAKCNLHGLWACVKPISPEP